MLGQTGFTDWSYKFGSAAVQRNEINLNLRWRRQKSGDAQMRSVAMRIYSDIKKQVPKLLPHKICVVFRSKLCNLGKRRRNGDERRRTRKP